MSVPPTFRWQQSTRPADSQRAVGKLGVQHLPVESRLLAFVLLPNTESKSTLRPREFCGCWGVGEAVNPADVNRQQTIRNQICNNYTSVPPNMTSSRCRICDILLNHTAPARLVYLAHIYVVAPEGSSIMLLERHLPLYI